MSVSSTPSSINYDKLQDHLVSEFIQCREQAAASVDRMRKIVDAIIVCGSSTSKQLNPQDFTVNKLINDLKTVDRYLKREITRAVARS